MSKEIDNIFIDVRNAFRLLSIYQKRVLSIVNYIREQTPYTDMWGSKNWFCNEIGSRRNSPDPEYAKLRIWKDMWGLDFLYNHFFEYYFGPIKINKRNIEMSLFQVSDDGYFLSDIGHKHMDDTSTYTSSENSHSFLIFNVDIYNTKYPKLWLHDPNFPEDSPKTFLTKFLESTKDKIIIEQDNEFTILKKYELQCFSTQERTNMVIADFAKLIKDHANIDLFKK